MIHLEDSVIIDAGVSTVYKIAEDVEKHPIVIPYFKSVKVLDKKDNMKLVKRIAKINGQKRSWIGKLIYHENKMIEYEQIDGPLKGMTGEWIFKDMNKHDQTKLTITHNINMKGFLVGRIMEMLAKKIVGKSAKNTLACIKQYAEKNRQ
jgi:uncharacterized membrane protein